MGYNYKFKLYKIKPKFVKEVSPLCEHIEIISVNVLVQPMAYFGRKIKKFKAPHRSWYTIALT